MSTAESKINQVKNNPEISLQQDEFNEDSVEIKDLIIQKQKVVIENLQNKVTELEEYIRLIDEEKISESEKYTRRISREEYMENKEIEKTYSNAFLSDTEIDNSNVPNFTEAELKELESIGSNTKKEKFSHSVTDSISIIRVDISNAIMDDAIEFKEFLNSGAIESPNTIIDLRECLSFDSTFLGVMVNFLKKSIKQNGDVRLVLGEETKSILFHVTRMDKVFSIYENIEDALLSYEVQDQ